MTVRYLPLVAVLLSLIFAAVPSRAGNKETAKKYFKSGLTLLKAEDFKAAASELERSVQFYPTKAGLYNLANCYRALHRYGVALETFKRLLRDYPKELQGEMKRDIQRQIDEIEGIVIYYEISVNLKGASVLIDGKRVGITPLLNPLVLSPGKHTLNIKLKRYDTISKEIDFASGAKHSDVFTLVASEALLSIVSNESGASISLDGQSVGTTPLDEPLAVNKGIHTVVVSKSGFLLATQTIELTPGESKTVTFDLIPTGTVVQEGATGSAAPAQVDKKKGRISPVLWVGVGGTVAFSGAAIAMWVARSSARELYNDNASAFNDNQERGVWPEEVREEEFRKAVEDDKEQMNTYKKLAVAMSATAGGFVGVTIAGIILTVVKKKKNIVAVPGGVSVLF